jgi:hypothetical protein
MSVTRPQDIAAEDAAENSRVTRERAERLASNTQAHRDDLPHRIALAGRAMQLAASEINGYAQRLRDMADLLDRIPAGGHDENPFGTSAVDKVSGTLTVMAHELPQSIARFRAATVERSQLETHLRSSGR